MDILDRFIEEAKASLARGYYSRGLDGMGMPRLSMSDAIGNHDLGIIAEIKHASPAGEYEHKDIDVRKTADSFRECGADGISVVVEPSIFKGDIGNVLRAKEAGLPVLFKDFIFSAEQVDAAARVGADCMLLVVKVADRMGVELDPLIERAHQHGMEVLLESYDEKELSRAMRTEADLLGINNRALTTLKVDIRRTARILKAVGGADRPLISESGIKSAGDVAYLKRAGADGILVGTAIWKAKDLEGKIRELRRGASS